MKIINVPSEMRYAGYHGRIHTEEEIATVQLNTEAARVAEKLRELGRSLWKELFVSIETEKQLSEWEQKIPGYECPCKKFYSEWKADNPPDFPLSFLWKYNLKSAVNAKLNRDNLSYEDALKFWNVDDRSADHS